LPGTILNSSRYLKIFDLFVLPSVKEGLPYTILEAMAAQSPIIATKVGGVSEIIENNKTGILVEPKNPLQLAEKIIYLLENEGLAQDYSLKAREKLEKEFQLKKMIEKTNELYKF